MHDGGIAGGSDGHSRLSRTMMVSSPYPIPYSLWAGPPISYYLYITIPCCRMAGRQPTTRLDHMQNTLRTQLDLRTSAAVCASISFRLKKTHLSVDFWLWTPCDRDRYTSFRYQTPFRSCGHKHKTCAKYATRAMSPSPLCGRLASNFIPTEKLHLFRPTFCHGPLLSGTVLVRNATKLPTRPCGPKTK